MEFSKKLAYIVTAAWLFSLVAYVILMIYKIDVWPAVTGTSAAETVVLGFYFNKSKAENKIKLPAIYSSEKTEINNEKEADG